MAKSNLTSIQTAAAKRLYNIWQRKKNELGLTQEKVCAVCDWSSQSTFSQFLHGKIPLNRDSVIKLSDVLEVTPYEIFPEMVDDALKMLRGHGDDSLDPGYARENQATYFTKNDLAVSEIKALLPNLNIDTILFMTEFLNDLRSGRLSEADLHLLKPYIQRLKGI